MVTNLIAGMPVPIWDRALVSALLDAAEGAERDLPIRRMAVVNDESQIYRRIIADGQKEFMLLLRCFAQRGFDMHLCGGEIVASLLPQQMRQSGQEA
jgi:hypothetical protein